MAAESEISIDNVWEIKMFNTLDNEQMEMSAISPLRPPKNTLNRNKSFVRVKNSSPENSKLEPSSPIGKKFILSSPKRLDSEPGTPGLSPPKRSKTKEIRISHFAPDYLNLKEPRKTSGAYQKIQVSRFQSMDLEKSLLTPGRAASKPRSYILLDDSLQIPKSLNNSAINQDLTTIKQGGFSQFASVRTREGVDFRSTNFPSPVKLRSVRMEQSTDS